MHLVYATCKHLCCGKYFLWCAVQDENQVHCFLYCGNSQSNVYFVYQTNAGEDYPQFGHPVANTENGRTQLSQLQHNSQNPKYGKCWTGALARLHEGNDLHCRTIKNFF